MNQGWKSLAKTKRSEAIMASKLQEFGSLGHMTSQPSKIAEGRICELMRAMDLGIHWGSLSIFRLNLVRE
jgi:hypothetical protein